MILPRLALRNVLAPAAAGPILTLMVLVAGYTALALAGGFMAQTFQGLADGAIQGGLGHIQILPAGGEDADEGQSLENALPEGEAAAARLRSDAAVAEVLPRIQFMGLASSGPRSVAFLGTAVDPGREPKYMNIAERLVPASRWIGTGPDSREAIVGLGLARSLGVAPGGSLTLMSTTKDGALNAVDVEVVGLEDLGLKGTERPEPYGQPGHRRCPAPRRAGPVPALRHPEAARRRGPGGAPAGRAGRARRPGPALVRAGRLLPAGEAALLRHLRIHGPGTRAGGPAGHGQHPSHERHGAAAGAGHPPGGGGSSRGACWPCSSGRGPSWAWAAAPWGWS